MISPEDIKLLYVTDSAQAAVRQIIKIHQHQVDSFTDALDDDDETLEADEEE